MKNYIDLIRKDLETVDYKKVKELQKLIDDNKYQVDADKLADAVINDQLAWRDYYEEN